MNIQIFSPTGNQDIYAPGSLQARISSENQVQCCHKQQELSLNALRRNSSLKYFCWLRRAGFGKSAHVSPAFDSARNTVSQTFVVALLKVVLRDLSQTSLITKIQCLPFLLRSLKMFYFICSLFTHIKYIFVCTWAQYVFVIVIFLLFSFSVNFC